MSGPSLRIESTDSMIISNSCVHTLFFLAAVCSTAVRNPVGKVNPESQNNTGGWVVVAHVENCSTRPMRSLVQAPSGLREGNALLHSGGTWALWMQVKTSSRSEDITTSPLMPFSSSTSDVRIVSSNTL